MKNLFNKIKKGIKDLVAEYKQVVWPTPRQTINLAIFVIVIAAIITLFITGLDWLFYELRSRFIIR